MIISTPGGTTQGPGPGRPPRWKQHEKDFVASLAAEKVKWLQRNIGPNGPIPLADILDLSRSDLLATFPGQPTRPKAPNQKPRSTLNDAGVIRVLAWQLAMKIGAGAVPRLDGNMRTAWYSYIEPFYLEKDLLDSDVGPEIDALALLLAEDAAGVLEQAEVEVAGLAQILGLEPLALWSALNQRSGALNRAARERYITNTMSNVFGELFMAGILDFDKDFGFVDPGEARYRIGKNRRGWILLTEKVGLRRLAERVGRRHEISWFVSQGEPSLLALYFMAMKLLKVYKTGKVKIGAVTDYDPFGYKIATSAQEKMGATPLFGPDNVELARLTGSQAMLRRLFTPAQLNRAKRDLSRYHRFKRKEIEEWFKITGGIGGERYGLHIDLADTRKMEKLITDWIEGRLGQAQGSN